MLGWKKHKLESSLPREISIYADDTTLMSESEEELKSLLMKEESEKVGLKLNIQKTKIKASGSITSWQIDGELKQWLNLFFWTPFPYSNYLTTAWQIDGETMERVTDFIFLDSKITADGDCSHEIKRRLLLGRKAMTNLDSILKSRDITLPTSLSSQRYGFSSSHVWM